MLLSPEIGFWGGMALLVSSITGPGLTTVPLIFQQAGWLLPVIAFLAVGLLSGSASLFLVEAMGQIRGNERFQAHVEFATIAELCLGKRSHVILQGILYLALQSVNISSIIISSQSMDTILIQLFHKTCAISFTQGWVCETKVNSTSGSPFTSYILISFGYLIAVVFVLPLSVLRLGQNIIVQLISAVTLICIFIIWIAVFFKHGLSNRVPVVGSDGSQFVGFVISNFAFVTTIPSFVNELNRNVSIHRTIWIPVIFCTLVYLTLGVLGAASYTIQDTSNILATISYSDQGRALGVLSIIINILFPLSVLVTSIPIFSIVIRYNLIRGRICSKKWALFWAALFPWILVIPFQTMGWLNIIVNWGSLLFASSANFVIPFLLYFISKRHRAISLPNNAEVPNSIQMQSLHSSISQDPQHSTSSHSVMLGVPEIQTSAAPEDSADRWNGKKDEDDLQALDDSLVVVVPSPSPDQSDEYLTSPVASDGSGHLLPTTGGGHLRRRSGSRRLDSIDLEQGSGIDTLRLGTGEQGVRRRSGSRRLDSVDLEIGGPNEASRPASDHYVESQGHVASSISLNGSVDADEAITVLNEPGSNHSSSHGLSSPDEVVFRAFPERRWFKSVIFAQVGFVLMTLMVLGNLIYTIIETAKGHLPV